MQLDAFIVSAILLLIAGSIAVALSRHLGLGSVLGLLVAGIIVGPHSPGPYVTQHVEDVRHFTELGVVLLLFLIGLEMRPGRLWALRREMLGMGSLQVLVTGLAIGLYISLYQPAWPTALLIGFTLALSSTAMVLQILQEKGEIASRHGTTAFSVLLLQDLAIVPLMAIVPILSKTGALSAEVPLWQQVGTVVGMLGLVVAFGWFVVPFALNRLARQGNREGFLMVIMLAVFLAAWATDQTGLSMALGAFLMGMLLSGSRHALQIQALVEPYKGLMMSLFFVSVGMSIDLQEILSRPGLFVQHTAVIVLIKIAVLLALALAFGLSRGVAVRITSLLSQGGEFGFLLFGSARVLDVIDDRTFALGVGVISVSMLATPLLVRVGTGLAQRLEATGLDPDRMRYREDNGDRPPRVILGGYGRAGHTIATILHSSEVPFIAFDVDLGRVEQGKADGFPVFYGDISDPDLLAAAHAERASLVILTVDRADAAVRATSHIRDAYPQLRVIARARDLEACGRLTEAGATRAFPETIESSLRLGAFALGMVGVPSDSVNMLLQDVRAGDYELVRPPERDPRGG